MDATTPIGANDHATEAPTALARALPEAGLGLPNLPGSPNGPPLDPNVPTPEELIAAQQGFGEAFTFAIIGVMFPEVRRNVQWAEERTNEASR